MNHDIWHMPVTAGDAVLSLDAVARHDGLKWQLTVMHALAADSLACWCFQLFEEVGHDLCHQCSRQQVCNACQVQLVLQRLTIVPPHMQWLLCTDLLQQL